MTSFAHVRGALAAAFFTFSILTVPATAQSTVSTTPAPKALTKEGDTPWIYEGSDVPQDPEWIFGELPNGLRYAVRKNGVPPDQISIRVRIDAGSLHERDDERGYAHLLEHLLFRESQYLGPAQAIPTWQRLGASFGSDTNAETSPTHTVYKLDLPNADAAKLTESMKLLSGMVRAPVLSDANVRAEVPIVLAEKRERGGAAQRSAETTRETLFAGQRLAVRSPIGTDETLTRANGRALSAFHRRWYRPEHTVIVAVGDIDPLQLAGEVEKWFGDWKPRGRSAQAPDFGDPVAPAEAVGTPPVGETAVVVEPDLPRSFNYGILRPWRPVQDTIAYNQGLLRDALAQALINRRLEARARGGGSYLYAQVQQDDISRSVDGTFVAFAPLSEDWQAALNDVRAVIADALVNPPTEEEIARETAEFEQIFVSSVEERSVQATAKLADDVVQAVDIRETIAAPEVVLDVFRGMKDTITPAQILEHTRQLFSGDVLRAAYVTPVAGEADASALRNALASDVAPDGSARLAENLISFADLPPIGAPGTVVEDAPIGVLDISRVDFANGVRALLYPNDGEPGRVTVKVRFNGGYRAVDPAQSAYLTLGQMALIASGLGELTQEDLDRVSTGRKLGFDFDVAEGAFTFAAQTRAADLRDQLYLFAGKLAMPRWDPNPVLRAQAAARLAYESYATSPVGVINRDLNTLLRDGDPRYATPTPAELAQTTPEGFRAFWEPILREGPVEVLIFGDFERDAAVAALAETFGALETRTALSDEVRTSVARFPAAEDTQVLFHRGDANQAAAVIAWPSGGGVEGLRESRQLEILIQVFNNRLLEALRERAGASYAPVVRSEWPSDVDGGGRISAIAQLQPEDVPIFFEESERIARDLMMEAPSTDELARVTEPLRQYVTRASTGNQFWLYQLEGATDDPRRIQLLRYLLSDLTRTSPDVMQTLARKYFGSRPAWTLAVIPQGQTLAAAPVSRKDR